MTRHEELIAALQHHFGFDSFKGNQEAIISNVMDGKDTFVLMPTGGGKSLCYQLPSLLMDGLAIVISPLIALMKNQVDAMRNFSEEDGIAHFINSSLSRPDIAAVKEDVLAGKTKLLYLAPESLQKDENIDFLQGVKISFYAVDEAHCISEWGHDFRPEYRHIRSMVLRIGKAPIIALTATATPKVQHDIQKNLDMLEIMEDLREFTEAEGGKELYDMLNDEQVFVIEKSALNIFQEQTLKGLRAKPGSQDDPKLMKKIKKLEGKRVNIFYHISESAPQQADSAAEPGTEGTPQP